MCDTVYSIRTLTPADGEDWRKIRLEALNSDPTAFGSTYDEECRDDAAAFAARIPQAGGPDAIFAAFVKGTIVGSATFVAEKGLKFRHKGHLFGLYVSASSRGRGIGAALIDAVLGHAAGHVEIVLASVVIDNAAARQLYERLGFAAYGLEPKGLRIDGIDYDVAELSITLGSSVP